MQSKASSVQQYLAELPADRREAIESVRALILKNLGEGFAEGMSYGMIGYFVPHSVYPAGYHCDPRQPVPYAGLASQKNHMSLYIMTLYVGGPVLTRFLDAWAKSGKKLDMGKCCIRFKKLEDLAVDAVVGAFRGVNAADHIKWYEASLRNYQSAAAAKKTAKKIAKKTTKKAPAKKPAVRTPTEKTSKKKASRAR